jgi:hypothetical protein
MLPHDSDKFYRGWQKGHTGVRLTIIRHFLGAYPAWVQREGMVL